MNEERTVTTEFLEHKHRFDSENELIKQLEKKPMTEGEVKEMLSRGYIDLGWAKLNKRFSPLVDDLRQRGLIVPDAPLTFEKFKSNNPGLLSIRHSTLLQMEMQEYSDFRNTFVPSGQSMLTSQDKRKYPDFKVYEDFPLDMDGQHKNKVQHYSYNQNGKHYVSGSGFMTANVIHMNPGDENRYVWFTNAKNVYDRSRKELTAIFKELGVNEVPASERIY